MILSLQSQSIVPIFIFSSKHFQKIFVSRRKQKEVDYNRGSRHNVFQELKRYLVYVVAFLSVGLVGRRQWRCIGQLLSGPTWKFPGFKNPL